VLVLDQNDGLGVSEVDVGHDSGQYRSARASTRHPEPSFFGPLPAQGLLIRHARNVEFHHVEITSIQHDARPFVWVDDK
jgi:hypothetical protein